MPEHFITILVALGAAVIASLATVIVSRRRPPNSAIDNGSGLVAEASDGSVPVSSDIAKPSDGADRSILALRSKRPNEVYVFGPTTELDGFGSPLATAPAQLARYATALRVGGDSVKSFAELSGRLVMVDDKTAAALQSGAMLRDKAGEILALTKNTDGKIASVARLRQVGGIAAGAASISNALSAMAMQAQLDRIEKQLSVISAGVNTVNRELLREWHAKTLGAQDMLREVYATACRTGELTHANWAQIASIGQVIRTQINGDRDRLAEAVSALEQLTRARDLKKRATEIDSQVETLRSAHAALTESTRTWVQYSALRLWYFTVTSDPTLEAYQCELETFIRRSHESIEPLRIRSNAAVRRLTEFKLLARARHPIAARRLPSKHSDALGALSRVEWTPLELRQPSKEVVVMRQHT